RRFEALVVFLIPLVVQDLNLHAGVGRIALERTSQGDAAVPLWRYLEFHPELKIAVLLVRHQPTAAGTIHVENAVLRAPDFNVAALIDLPADQVLAVEEGFEPFRNFGVSSHGGRHEAKDGCHRQEIKPVAHERASTRVNGSLGENGWYCPGDRIEVVSSTTKKRLFGRKRSACYDPY